MAHDTIYKKPDLSGGFGASLMDSIEKRMAAVMRTYLLPAGYEFQKVLNDFERLSKGKELFDVGLLKLIQQGDDNNERADLLDRFSEYVLPYYDDAGSVYDEVRDSLGKAAKKARASAEKPIETPFGTLPGVSATQIAAKIADIIDHLRYLNIEGTFDFIVRMFADSTDSGERERWVRSAEGLAKHDMHVWQKAGPVVQERLITCIKKLPKAKKQRARSPLVADTGKPSRSARDCPSSRCAHH